MTDTNTDERLREVERMLRFCVDGCIEAVAMQLWDEEQRYYGRARAEWELVPITTRVEYRDRARRLIEERY